MSEISNYIIRVIKQKPFVVMSWGFSAPRSTDTGLIFHVNGFKHVGYVKVIYNEGTDLFDITLMDDDFNQVGNYSGVYVDELTNVIDDAVEYTNDYSERVTKFYNHK